MLLQMAVEMNVSFRALCECEIFRSFLQSEIGWTMPSRMTLHRLLPIHHLVGKLRDELASVESLSITTDSTFLTRHQVPYICITGHWIDKDWQLHGTVLAVFLAEQSETADFISTKLKETLESQLGIRRKLHCITTDEGQNFLAAVDNLKHGEVVRESVRCACHRVQLLMKNAYNDEKCNGLKQLLDKCGTLVNVFKNGWASTKRDVLSRYQKQHMEQLQSQLTELEREAAHNTRALTTDRDALKSLVADAVRLLAQDESDTQQAENNKQAQNDELLDVSIIRNSDILTQPIEEIKDDTDESKNDLEFDMTTSPSRKIVLIRQNTRRLTSTTFSTSVRWYRKLLHAGCRMYTLSNAV